MVDPNLKAYLERWKAVEEVERREQQAASMELRWQQLNSLVRLARGLGLQMDMEEEKAVFERWAKLKEGL